MHKKYFKAFTLVELIIVITILAILATIAFMSFSNYTKSARDANRVATLTNIEKWLQTFQISSGKYPIPDETINVTDSWTIIGYQWIIWKNVSDVIKISNIPTDPQDWKNYVYSRNERWNKYQIMGFLEMKNNQTAFISQIYADVSRNFPITQGNELWIILEENNSLIRWDIDLRNYSWAELTAYISDNKIITWTWETLKTLISNFKPGKTWRELDINCEVDDIVIWNQIWAGCNSTLWDGISWRGATCYSYSESTTSCLWLNYMKSSSKEKVWPVAINNDGTQNNIWGSLYTFDQSFSACPNWRKVPSDVDFMQLEQSFWCLSWQLNRNNSWWCNWLGWSNNSSMNKNTNIVIWLWIPLSWRVSLNWDFYSRWRRAHFWSSTEWTSNNAYYRTFYWSQSWIHRNVTSKNYWFSVRCIKE